MTRLNQTITRWQGMGLIATTLLGTGVFILPQHTIAAAGDQAIWSWLILLLAILPLAYVFAELGRSFTHAAGSAYFVQRAFGNTAGRITGLLFLFAVPPGVAAALIMTFEFLRPLVSLSSEQNLCAELLVFLILFFINRRGLQLSGKFQLVLTLMILSVVTLMLVMLALNPPIVASSNSTSLGDSSMGGNGDMVAAIGLAIWSFLGIEAITHLAGEFKDVKRDFIPATLGGVVLVGLIFMGCTWLSMLAPDHSLAMVGAFELLLGDSGRIIIGGLGFISGIATINVYFASLSRLAWSFSNEGVLPAGLKRLNSHNIPSTALLAFVLISALMLLVSYLAELDFVGLVYWVNGAFVLIYTSSMLAAWKLLPNRQRPIVIASLVACCLFIYCLGNSMIYAFLLTIAIALGLLVQKYWLVVCQVRSATEY